jgi:PAS domain S-box-containing protein
MEREPIEGSIVNDALIFIRTEMKNQHFEEERYGLALVSSPEFKLIFVNSKLAKMLGCTIAELTAFTLEQLMKLIHPNDIEQIQEHFRALSDGTENVPQQVYRFLRKDGTEVSLSLKSSPIVVDGNLSLYAVFVEYAGSSDIEFMREESPNFYETLIKLAPDGIITANFKGLITSINPAFTELTGYTEEHMLNKHFNKIGAIWTRDLSKYLKLFNNMMQGKETKPVELEYKRKDGSIGWGEFHLSSVTYENNTKEILAIFRDTTSRRRISEKLKVVGKLTRHDIRNKLSVIMGYLDLVKMSLNKGRPIEDYIAKIQDAAYQIVKILNFSADYEKLGNEEKKPIAISQNFKTALSMFSLGDIQVEEQCDGLVVYADNMISRVFYNFIDNTLCHGGNVGKIRLYTEIGDYLQIIYEDDGIGIPIDKKKKIFEEDIEKTGIHGLNLINRIIKTYRWKIKEEGTPGKGVKFVITIPKENMLIKEGLK